MELLKIGKKLIIVGIFLFISYILSGILIWISSNYWEISTQTAKILGAIINYLIISAFTIMWIGAIIYDVSKRKMKNKNL